MSQAEILPFRFSDYAAKLDDGHHPGRGWAKDAAMPIDVASLRAKATAVRQAPRRSSRRLTRAWRTAPVRRPVSRP